MAFGSDGSTEHSRPLLAGVPLEAPYSACLAEVTKPAGPRIVAGQRPQTGCGGSLTTRTLRDQQLPAQRAVIGGAAKLRW